VRASGSQEVESVADATPVPLTPVDAEALPISLDDRLRELEQNLIIWALRVTGGNKSRAAHLLKIKRSTLGDRINRCGLDEFSAADEPLAIRASA
jgi:DNA-binding NtrC family response regulator